MYLSIYRALSLYLFVCLSICLSVHLSVYLSFCPSIYQSICPCICLSICLFIYLSIYLCLSVYLSVYLPDWKRTSSARLPHFSNLTTSKTKQFCDTSFICQHNNVQNRSNSARLPLCLNLTTSKTKQFCETSFKKWKVECSAGSLVPMRFAIFPLHLCKVLHLPRKIDARSYEVLHLSRKIISANLKIWYSKMQPLSGNGPNISDEHVFCTAPATRNASLKILFKCPTPAIVFGNAAKHSRFAHFWQGAQSFAHATQNDISTSKSGPTLKCFVTFDLEMCFAPQRRALFRHLNFQKWSEAEVFCTFWLGNVLRATTACTFSTSQLPKVVREWCVLHILTSKCASRHNGVHFFDISTSKSAPRPRCFVHFDFEMCFAPQRRATFHFASPQMSPHLPL